MKKNFFTIIVILALALTTIGLIGCSDDENDKESSAKDIIGFVVDNMIGDAVIDAVNHTVTVNVSVFDISALTVTIDVSPKATVSPASGDVVDFSAGPVTFTVTAEDGSTQDWVVTVNTPVPFQATFKVIDGTESYTNIKIKGTMNNWVPAQMYDDGTNGDEVAGDHTWSLTMTFADTLVGDHEWGAIEDDGSEWGIWLIDGPNRQFHIDENGAVTGELTYEIPVPGEGVNITFKVDMNNETVSEEGVFVAGSFQNWTPLTTQLLDDDSDGIYEVTVQLNAGDNLLFKFMNGQSWEAVPSDCGVDDGFGGYNRNTVVPDADATIGYVYSTCDTIP